MRSPETIAPDTSNLSMALDAMEALMRREQYDNSATPTQIAVELWKEHKITSLADFEVALRIRGSRVYFIAIASDSFGPSYHSVYPEGTLSGEPAYALYVAVNGGEEARKMLLDIRTTSDGNLERLKRTGLLARK